MTRPHSLKPSQVPRTMATEADTLYPCKVIRKPPVSDKHMEMKRRSKKKPHITQHIQNSAVNFRALTKF